METELTAKKISTIRISFGSFLKKLRKFNFDDAFTVKVIFGLCGTIIKRAEGIDELMYQMVNIAKRETNGDNGGHDPTEHRHFSENASRK